MNFNLNFFLKIPLGILPEISPRVLEKKGHGDFFGISSIDSFRQSFEDSLGKSSPGFPQKFLKRVIQKIKNPSEMSSHIYLQNLQNFLDFFRIPSQFSIGNSSRKSLSELSKKSRTIFQSFPQIFYQEFLRNLSRNSFIKLFKFFFQECFQGFFKIFRQDFFKYSSKKFFGISARFSLKRFLWIPLETYPGISPEHLQ